MKHTNKKISSFLSSDEPHVIMNNGKNLQIARFSKINFSKWCFVNFKNQTHLYYEDFYEMPKPKGNQ